MRVQKQRIERLTTDQENQLAPWRDQWLNHGLSTRPADRPRAEAGVRKAYEAAGLEPPKLIIWLDSPMAGCIGAAMLASGKVGAQVGDQVWDQVWAQVGDQVGAQVGDQVWAQVWDQVGAQVWAQVGAQVRDQVRDQVWAQVGDQVRDQVGDQVWDQVWAQVWAQVGAQVGDQVWAQVWDQVGAQVWAQVYKAAWGQHDAWLSFYDYMHRVVGITDAARLDGVIEIAQSSGWWWPFAGAVILTERPTVLHRDAQTRLHCEDGPALAYPDGWAVYAWHGVRVPADLIAGSWSTDDILREPNAEVRRCAIERLGWDQFVFSAGLKQVGPTVPDPGNPGHELSLYDVPEQIYDEPVRVLLCDNATPERDGTRRRFGLTVPADIDHPVAAAAWTFGLTQGEYAQLQHAY